MRVRVDLKLEDKFVVVLPLLPKAKPRMTARDKWKKRPVVVAYREFKDKLRELMKSKGITELPECDFRVIFCVPMPKSWSYKKRQEWVGSKHQSRPDADNFLKGLQDGIKKTDDDHDAKEDSGIWDVHITKIWSHEGAIMIVTNDRLH